MKKKDITKKNIGGFAPELHWDLILMFLATIIIAIAGYFSYVYITLNHHIQNISVAANANDGTSTDELALKKIVNMESVIAGYRERDQAYHDLLKALAAGVRAPVIATSTATTTIVATSTLR